MHQTSSSPPLQVGGDSPYRKPGRPKGSGKKYPDVPQSSTSIPPKSKRPVGRPRKDGFPAGSGGARQKLSHAAEPAMFTAPAESDPSAPNSVMFAYPPGQIVFPYAVTPGRSRYTMCAPPHTSHQSNGSVSLLPTLRTMNEEDEWADLSQRKPSLFLDALVHALAALNPVSTSQTSLEESFKSHLVSLAQKSPHPLPSLYSILKTFWLPSSPAYFSLTASTRTPPEHRFLYWDPQPLVINGIACPSCSAPLLNRGRIRSGPIKVYDLERPFFVIGCEYVCTSLPCVAQTSPGGRCFASTDASVLRALPVRLRDEFPAHLMQGAVDAGSGADVWRWRAMGVSRGLWDMVRACLRVGLGKDAILYVIKSTQLRISDRKGEAGEAGEAETREGEEEQAQEQEHGQDGLHPLEGDLSDPSLFIDPEDYRRAYVASATPTTLSSSPLHQLETGASSPLVSADSSKTVIAAVAPAAGEPASSHPVFSGFAQAAMSPYHFYPTYPYLHMSSSTSPVLPHAHHTGQIQQTRSASGMSLMPPSTLRNPPAPAPALPLLSSPLSPHELGPQLAIITPAETSQPSLMSGSRVGRGPGSGPSLSATMMGPLKRPYDSVATIIEPAQKRRRHCCKCGSQECKGKGGRSFCTNWCQDCGKLDCRGRNSRRPDKTCSEAWS